MMQATSTWLAQIIGTPKWVTCAVALYNLAYSNKYFKLN